MEAQPKPFADVASLQVGRVYAEALLRLALEQNQAQEIFDDLQALQQKVVSDPGVHAFIGNAAIGRERKGQVLEHAFRGKVPDILTNFVQVLNSHDRLEILGAVVICYKELLDARKRVARVAVASAQPLTEAQLTQIRDFVHAIGGRDPVLETRIDPELIGGVVVRVGDWLYDASVRRRLETMRDQLNERSSHEIQSGRNRFFAD